MFFYTAYQEEPVYSEIKKGKQKRKTENAPSKSCNCLQRQCVLSTMFSVKISMLILKSFSIKVKPYNFCFFSFICTVCQMCPNDWIEFNKSCYYFYNFNSSLKTWDESRQFCQNNKSDLVVISNYCNDTQYGYWIGLRKISNNWTWVDDTQETLGLCVRLVTLRWGLL
uniref:C-type lectin domain-containing protein n=1 Tax=Oryzias melastigma TaxID=30732 RepID=A0A3B3CLN9_ORYME